MVTNKLLAAWQGRGTYLKSLEDEVFVFTAGESEAPAILLLHGFPGSSFDWNGVVEGLAGHARIVAPDFVGYGLSSKPPRGDLGIMRQADIVCDVVGEMGLSRCTVVAHDMGDTVAAELLHRANADELSFAIDRVFLTNGSIYIDMAILSEGQIFLLELPDEPLPDSLDLEVFRPALKETFGADTQPTDEALDVMLAAIAYNDGDRILPRLIRYISERRANQPRWTDALNDYVGPMTSVWGRLDPIAVVAMTDRLSKERPATEVIVLDDIGHWPALEAPDRLVEVILQRLDDELPPTGLLGAE